MKKIAMALTAVSLLGFLSSFIPESTSTKEYKVNWGCPCKDKKKKQTSSTTSASSSSSNPSSSK